MADTNAGASWVPSVVASMATGVLGYFTARLALRATERANRREGSATVTVARIEAGSAEQERVAKRLEKVESDLDDVRSELDAARDERRQSATTLQLLRYSYAVFRRKVKVFIHHWNEEYVAQGTKPSPHLKAIAEDLEHDDHEIDELLGEHDEPTK